MKATRVDGVYSADPEKNPHAVRYEHLTYDQVLRDELKVMDMTAIGMCLDNTLPILVFNFKKEGNIERAIAGEPIGTWVGTTPRPRGVALGLSRTDLPSTAVLVKRVRSTVPGRARSPPRPLRDGSARAAPSRSAEMARAGSPPHRLHAATPRRVSRPMSIEEIVLEAEERMEKTIGLLEDQFKGVRTGRASTGLVESIRVPYYGSPTPLKQLANLSTPEPQQILIRPFDPSAIGDIIKAIQTSDLGLTPNSDNKVVRLNVPSLSVEQRKKLVSRVKELAEEARISIRNIRRDANKQADQASRPTRSSPRTTSPACQGRDPGPHQEVRGQGQRPRREEVGRDPRRLTESGPNSFKAV